eukprot:TRINITY_DN412_c1_g1_i3.p1 TRINITY_DN412_c1_g1~~TRINITY_DN412_c1_g1_i3.p1  ORF type:complete len:333 (-),score=51.52 TRINITY_DN412_c1_g1_i3:504-1502(-)
MTIPFISVLFLGFSFLALQPLCIYADAQSVETSGCVITNDSCPCSQSAASGTCLKYQGDGSCLLGTCQASYKCDCLGYEMCKRSSCAVYTAMENTVPSELVPFGCHLTPGAGSCTSFEHVLDTVEAAQSAKADARHSNIEATIQTSDAQNIVMEAYNDVMILNNALGSLDEVSDVITNEEEKEIYEDVQTVRDLAMDCVRGALNVSMEGDEAFKSSVEAAIMAKTASEASNEGKKLEGELKQENLKAKEKGECLVCKKLQDDIQKLRELRKQAAQNAGKAGRRGKSNRNKSSGILKEMREKRVKCGEARDRVLAKIESIKKRMQRASQNVTI